jgi:hypothetical protein
MKLPLFLLVSLAVLGLSWRGAAPVGAQSTPAELSVADTGLGADPASPRILRCIEALGAQQFEVREAATAELLAGGEPALLGLRAVSTNSPFEVRQRADLIRRRIEADKFASLSRNFLLDLDDRKSYGLPAWDAYRDLVGGTRTSKLMYLDMLREQPELSRLLALATGHDASATALRALESLGATEAVRLRERLFAVRQPRLGDAVSMLMIAATLPEQVPVEISDMIVTYERLGFSGYSNEPGYSTCLRRLLSVWLPKTHASMALTAMECALNNELSQGAEIARKHLTPNFDSDTRKLAFYCLAKYGNETDLPRLMPLLTDQKVVDEIARSAIEGGIHESHATPPGLVPRDPSLSKNMVVRVQDLAFTTAMILLDQDPKQYYPRFEIHDRFGFFIHSLAAPPEAVDAQQQLINQWAQQRAGRQVGS